MLPGGRTSESPACMSIECTDPDRLQEALWFLPAASDAPSRREYVPSKCAHRCKSHR